MKDNEIIELYWKRNEAAIAVTADAYGSYCHSISYNILHNHEDAAECVNDTWFGAWKSIPPKRPERLSTYLGKITRNLSLNRLKQYSAAKRGAGADRAGIVRTGGLYSGAESCGAGRGGDGAGTGHQPVFVWTAGAAAKYVCAAILVSVFHPGYCQSLRYDRE